MVDKLGIYNVGGFITAREIRVVDELDFLECLIFVHVVV